MSFRHSPYLKQRLPNSFNFYWLCFIDLHFYIRTLLVIMLPQTSTTPFIGKVLKHTVLLLVLLLVHSYSAHAVSTSHSINNYVSYTNTPNCSSGILTACEKEEVQIVAEECIEEDDETIESISAVNFFTRTANSTSTNSSLSPERISRFNAIPRYILYRNLKAYVLA